MDDNETRAWIRETTRERAALRKEITEIEEHQGLPAVSEWQRWDDMGQSILEAYESLGLVGSGEDDAQ